MSAFRILGQAAQAAYDEGVAAERERIRRLATDSNARYIPGCTDPGCPGTHMVTAPFADLLDEATP